MRKHFGKFIDRTTLKFILVGMVNTLFGGAVMFVCYNLFSLSYWISSALNYLLGSLLSFFLNKYFTFQSKKKSFREVFRFIVNILFSYLIAYGIARPLARKILGASSFRLRENLAMAIGLFLFTVINYLGQRFFVFRQEP